MLGTRDGAPGPHDPREIVRALDREARAHRDRPRWIHRRHCPRRRGRPPRSAGPRRPAARQAARRAARLPPRADGDRADRDGRARSTRAHERPTGGATLRVEQRAASAHGAVALVGDRDRPGRALGADRELGIALHRALRRELPRHPAPSPAELAGGDARGHATRDRRRHRLPAPPPRRTERVAGPRTRALARAPLAAPRAGGRSDERAHRSCGVGRRPGSRRLLQGIPTARVPGVPGALGPLRPTPRSPALGRLGGVGPRRGSTHAPIRGRRPLGRA